MYCICNLFSVTYFGITIDCVFQISNWHAACFEFVKSIDKIMKDNSMLLLVFPVNSSFVPQLVPYVNWGFFKLLHSQPSSRVDQSFKVHSNNESQISVAKKQTKKFAVFSLVGAT